MAVISSEMRRSPSPEFDRQRKDKGIIGIIESPLLTEIALLGYRNPQPDSDGLQLERIRGLACPLSPMIAV